MNFKTPLFDDTEPFGFDEGTLFNRDIVLMFNVCPCTIYDASIKGPHKATHGHGEASSQHHHRGQHTPRHEVSQAWGAVIYDASLTPTGVFGMNFKTPLFDDTEPFGFDEGTILE